MYFLILEFHQLETKLLKQTINLNLKNDHHPGILLNAERKSDTIPHHQVVVHHHHQILLIVLVCNYYFNLTY